MINSLTTSELNGLLDSVIDDRASMPKFVTAEESFYADSLDYAAVKNRVHLHPTGFGSEIAQHLRHIPVNPNNITASQLLRKSYVHSIAYRTNSDDDLVVNASDRSLMRFMAHLIKSAKRERNFATNSQSANSTIGTLNSKCVHVIHGERGVGKTFFLNYALTRCSEALDRRKTIWVRLNFVYSSGFENDIEYWMQAQAAKIVLRYYDMKSSYSSKRVVGAVDHLFTWIAGNDRLTPDDRSRLRANLRSMEQVFGRQSEDEALRPSLCDREICRELYRFMRSIGWSFIFVLDGFDQLDINPEQVSRFELIRSKIQNFISMRAVYGACIVVVSRTNTFNDLKAFDPFKGIPETRKYRICNVDFSTVVSKRFDAIKEVVIRRIPEHRRESAEQLESVITSFLRDEFIGDALFSKGTQFDQSNIRAKLQTLYLMFLNYANESTGKGYLIVEHMLLNGMRYPAVAYKYSEASRNELAPIAFEVSHEARFLPLITKYPLPSNYSSFAIPQNPLTHLLLGVRALQIVVAANQLQKSQEVLSVGELTSILFKCFGYQKPIVLAEINELAAFDLLRIIRREGLPTSSQSNCVKILPKTEFMLMDALFEAAYLNLCAMRTLFPRRLFELGLVRCSFLGSDLHAGQKWVGIKVINSLTLYSIMIFLNRFEMREFSRLDQNSLSDRERTIVRQAVQGGMWDLIKHGKSRLVVEIIGILSSGARGWLSDEDKMVIADRVRSMFGYWRSSGA